MARNRLAGIVYSDFMQIFACISNGYRADYRDGVSYRGRKRDSMGRYSRADAKEDMVDKLRRMIDEAPDSRTREALEKAVRCMED